MSFESDLRNTLLDVRTEHTRRQEERKKFDLKWGELRQTVFGPVLGDAVSVLNELGRAGKKDFYNGSIGLSFGQVPEDETRPSWTHTITFKPDDNQKLVVITASTNKTAYSIPIVQVDRPRIERSVTDFLREAEEDLISREK